MLEVYYTLTHLHQVWIFIRREAIDVFSALQTLSEQKAWKTLLHRVSPGNLLSPVAHINLNNLLCKDNNNNIAQSDMHGSDTGLLTILLDDKLSQNVLR